MKSRVCSMLGESGKLLESIKYFRVKTSKCIGRPLDVLLSLTQGDQERTKWHLPFSTVGVRGKPWTGSHPLVEVEVCLTPLWPEKWVKEIRSYNYNTNVTTLVLNYGMGDDPTNITQRYTGRFRRKLFTFMSDKEGVRGGWERPSMTLCGTVSLDLTSPICRWSVKDKGVR